MAVILITAGASGGHIFPALRSAALATQQGWRVICVWPQDAGRRFLTDRAMQDVVMPVAQKNKFVLLEAPLSMVQSIPHAASVLRRYSPSVAIGFGGRQTLPYLMMAKIRKAVVLVHEQNVRMGRANRLMGWIADAVLTSFPVTPKPSSHCQANGRRMFHVGLPTLWAPDARTTALDADQKAMILHRLGLEPRDRTLLIIGGSQGSRALSEAVWVALSRRRAAADVCQVIHLCGVHQDEHHWMRKWRQIGVRAHVASFMTQMGSVYQVVDAAVTRAGANVLTELALFGVPAVIVPYPGAGGHQWDNARYFERLGCGVIWPQESGRPDELVELLQAVLSRSRRASGCSFGDDLLSRDEIERRFIQTLSTYLNR